MDIQDDIRYKVYALELGASQHKLGFESFDPEMQRQLRSQGNFVEDSRFRRCGDLLVCETEDNYRLIVGYLDLTRSGESHEKFKEFFGCDMRRVINIHSIMAGQYLFEQEKAFNYGQVYTKSRRLLISGESPWPIPKDILQRFEQPIRDYFTERDMQLDDLVIV